MQMRDGWYSQRPQPVDNEARSTGSGLIEVLLLDPNAFTRECTQALLKQVAEFRVQAFCDFNDAPAECRPDVVLLRHLLRDGLPVLDKQLNTARSIWPECLTLLVTDAEERSWLSVAVNLGVAGVLKTDSDAGTLIRSIRIIDSGLLVMPRTAVQDLLGEEKSLMEPSVQKSFAHWQSRNLGLTTRQADVVKLLISGLSNRSIARTLGISESTVKAHVRSTMAQSGARSRTQLVALVLGNMPPLLANH